MYWKLFTQSAKQILYYNIHQTKNILIVIFGLAYKSMSNKVTSYQLLTNWLAIFKHNTWLIILAAKGK